jgi:HlyD family secretion protein
VKRWIIIALAVVVVAVIVFANLKRSSTPSVKARLSKVELADLTAEVSAPGRVRSVASVDISAEVMGRVVELNVAEGDSVTAGQVLLRLEDTQYRSRVGQARAALQSAKASLELADARHEKASRDRERTVAMHEKGLASEERLDTVLADYRITEAELKSRRQEVQRFESALIEAEDNLEKTVYRAPVSGIVSRLNIEKGENVIIGTMNNPGTVILTISDLSRMEVEAEVDETDVVTVQVGQQAEISVDAIPDTTFAGTVATVGHSGRQQRTGTADEVINFEVRVRFAEDDPRLRPGMTADVEIFTEHRIQVMAVPIQALVARTRGALQRERRDLAERLGETRPESPAKEMEDDARRKWEREIVEGIYTVEDGEARFVEVTTGIADQTRIEITGEVEEGDEVVSGPYRVLRNLTEGTEVERMSSGDD